MGRAEDKAFSIKSAAVSLGELVRRGVRAVFDTVKNQVNKAFDDLRRNVRGIFNLLRLANKVTIELWRSAAVGIITAGGEGLKAIVRKVHEDAPEIAERAQKKIDALVDDAIKVVDDLADILSAAIGGIIAFFCKAVDDLLFIAQKIDTAVIEALKLLLVDFDELWQRVSNITAAFSMFGALFPGFLWEAVIGINPDDFKPSGDEAEELDEPSGDLVGGAEPGASVEVPSAERSPTLDGQEAESDSPDAPLPGVEAGLTEAIETLVGNTELSGCWRSFKPASIRR